MGGTGEITRRNWRGACRAALFGLLLWQPHAVAAPLRYATRGGDAWTFDKEIVIQAEATCDSVAVASSRAITVSPIDNGRVRVHIPLRSGANVVTATCRRGDQVQGPAIAQTWHVRLPHAPRAQIDFATTGEHIILSAANSRPAPADGKPVVHAHWSVASPQPGALPNHQAKGLEITIPTPSSDGDYAATVRVTDADGLSDESTIAFRVRDGVAGALKPEDRPAWTDDAVVYGVVPTFFGRRGFDDVTAQIDRLVTLGVNTLWLAPLTATPPGDYGYAVTDYFRIRADYGHPEDLRELIEAAHTRGLRVIMDFVPNHLSVEHPYFADTVRHGERSPYYKFFARDHTGAPTHYFDWADLKNLNFDDPEVQTFVIAAFAHWLREFDVDGFRVDVAWGPRERAPAFWPRWRAELKRIKPDLLLLAEASARDPFYLQHGFDATYDWTDSLGQWAWQSAFSNSVSIPALQDAILRSPGHTVMRFLNNNDTGPRFVSRHGQSRTRVAAAMLLTLPGIPALYTGDEVGAAFEPYQTESAIRWADESGLQAWYARLIALRKQLPALRSGRLMFLDTGHPDVLAYVREDSQDEIIVILNYGDSSTRPQLAGISAETVLTDRLSGEQVALGETALPPHAVQILHRKKNEAVRAR